MAPSNKRMQLTKRGPLVGWRATRAIFIESRFAQQWLLVRHRTAAKLEPGFKRKPGTRYLLNRWRGEQLSVGRRITYGHLVKQAIVLNKTKQGPLRVEHGRYINFISDFMAQDPRRSPSDAVRAWEEVKRMDAPKTYEAWVARAKRRWGGPVGQPASACARTRAGLEAGARGGVGGELGAG